MLPWMGHILKTDSPVKELIFWMAHVLTALEFVANLYHIAKNEKLEEFGAKKQIEYWLENNLEPL